VVSAPDAQIYFYDNAASHSHRGNSTFKLWQILSLMPADGAQPKISIKRIWLRIGAPEWHGHNLDAVWDSLTGGDINQRNLPFQIRITVATQMGVDAREMVKRFAALIEEARKGGYSVAIEILP
jgi:RNAse (barnase) inhibitor barstar